MGSTGYESCRQSRSRLPSGDMAATPQGCRPAIYARRMAETAAHLVDHVFTPLPVRQWVLSVPKRLRYHLERDPAVLNAALHGGF